MRLKPLLSAPYAIAAVVLLLLMQSLHSQVLQSSDSLSAVLTAKENEMFHILINGDKQAAETLLGADYLTIDADGVMQEKASTISTLGKFKGSTFELSDRKIRVYSNIAVINGRAKFHMKGILAADVFYTEIWIYRNTAWQFIGWQGTMTGLPSNYPVILTIIGLLLLFLLARFLIRRRKKRIAK